MTKAYQGNAHDFERSISGDPAVLMRERKHLRKLWREFRDKNPRLAAQYKRMSAEQLAEYEIELLERLLVTQPEKASAAYDLRLAHELRASRSRPRPRRQVPRRRFSLPAPASEPQGSPDAALPAFMASTLAEPSPEAPTSPVTKPMPEQPTAVLLAFPKSFGVGREVHWHGLNDW